MDLSCPASSQEKTKTDQITFQNIDLITQKWHSSLWNKPTTAMKNSFKSSRLGTLAGGLTFFAENFIMRHATAPMQWQSTEMEVTNPIFPTKNFVATLPDFATVLGDSATFLRFFPPEKWKSFQDCLE